jgi:3-hydroxybutyryl-CoA dehydrogenase
MECFMTSQYKIVGIAGSGAMGSGIAQVAARAGHEVILYDVSQAALEKAMVSMRASMDKLVAKGTVSKADADALLSRISTSHDVSDLSPCSIVIEAVIEDLGIKKELFTRLEGLVSESCLLATNTSSLSVTSVAASLAKPQRCVGIHFFNPAPLMRLVEMIPAVQTSTHIIDDVQKLISQWGKNTVLAKDTPGFIVNKIARPFYGEAIRILEEGLADIHTIDHAMTSLGFRMGPFTLMDFIGHDVNYRVTESVWRGFYFDSRYKPSFSQLRLMEAGFLGRKSGRGFYNYAEGENMPDADTQDMEFIQSRILCMLVNEAADTVWQGICSQEDADTAVCLGLNYPKGLLAWGHEIGYDTIVAQLEQLHETYREERYRVCPLLKKLAKL